jgi:hypothetical protein
LMISGMPLSMSRPPSCESPRTGSGCSGRPLDAQRFPSTGWPSICSCAGGHEVFSGACAAPPRPGCQGWSRRRAWWSGRVWKRRWRGCRPPRSAKNPGDAVARLEERLSSADGRRPRTFSRQMAFRIQSVFIINSAIVYVNMNSFANTL